MSKRQSERYVFAVPGKGAVKAVRRGCGDAVKHMPPVLVSFLYHTYNGGGWPIYHSGNAWDMVTSEQHIRIDVQTPHRARLRAWGKRVNRGLNRPAVDRIIECEEA